MDDVRDPITSFKTFNEFFYRKVKPHARTIADPRNHRIAVMPADSRVVAFADVKEQSRLFVKGENFTLAELLQDAEMAKKYEHGSMAICRLGPEDIHRFLVPATCKVGPTKIIDGEYYSNNPVVVRENVDVYTSNVRTVTTLKKTAFGDIIYICVGTTMIGSVNITVDEGTILKKGDELGYFAFGGSTVIVLFERDKIVFAEDIETNTAKLVETYCWMGSPLAVVRNKM